MISYYDNGYSLGALSGNTVLLSDYIGKFFTVTKDITKFSGKPGDFNVKQLSTVKAGGNMGTIIDIQKASDGKYWAQTSWGGWFNFNAYAPALVEKKLATDVQLTDEQKKDILLNIVKLQPGGAAVAVAVDVASGVIDTASSALDFTAWLGRNLKTVLILGGVGFATVYGWKIYKEVKG